MYSQAAAEHQFLLPHLAVKPLASNMICGESIYSRKNKQLAFASISCRRARFICNFWSVQTEISLSLHVIRNCLICMVNTLHFFIISICFGISPISFWELAKQGREGHLLGSWGNNGDSKFIWKINHYTLCIAEYQVLSNTQQMIKTLSPCSEVQNLRILLLCFHGAFYWKISLSSRNYYELISNTFARLTVTSSGDVLVLARTEFIFFPAAAMVLCFGFRMRIK